MKLIKNILLIILVLNASAARSQDDKARLDDLMRKDTTDINALAGYPDSTRHNIFVVSTQSAALARLGDAQKKSNDDFKNLISSYSKDDQQKIWNLTRYDNLINQLATGGQKTNDQLEAILKNYPQDAHDDAINIYANHYDLLVSINNVNQTFSDSYNDITKDFPVETQNAYTQLLNQPDAISIMTGNIQMTAALGDIYNNNPALVKQEFDSLNQQLARQKAQDVQAWKDSLQNNPAAMSELQASAKDYAKSNGYSQSDYSTDPNVVASYRPQPYPYWAGPPSWYGPDYWYPPNPYWYDCGFYYYGGGIVFTGVPTYQFAYWGFNHYPHYFYSYPNLSNLYFNRYYGANSAVIYNANGRSTARIMNQWVNRNQGSLPDGFLTSDGNRADRFRELGQAEMDRRQYNKANPTAKMNRQQYMTQNVSSYPHIQATGNNYARVSSTNPSPHSAPAGQQRASGPTPVYQSPPANNTNRNNNGARQVSGRQANSQQQRNGQRQQMQRPQQQQRSQPAPRQGSAHEEGGGRGR